MSRTPRIMSQSGYMHVIARGINKQDIFLDEGDFWRFIGCIHDLKPDFNIKFLALCLMTNHVHLLLLDENEPRSLSRFMHALCSRYAQYFNKKYGRSGHLFQGRYSSRAVETTQYLMICLRYIHNNPQKAGISTLESYPWSSYRTLASADWGQAPIGTSPTLDSRAATSFTTIKNSCISESSFHPTIADICDTELVTQLFSSAQDYVEFHGRTNLPSDMALTCFDEQQAPSDNAAKEVICYFLKNSDPSSIQSIPRLKRIKILSTLKSIGLKPTQISRITGLSLSIISHMR